MYSLCSLLQGLRRTLEELHGRLDDDALPAALRSYVESYVEAAALLAQAAPLLCAADLRAQVDPY